MKLAIGVALVLASADVNADDFSERWNALAVDPPPTITQGVEPTPTRARHRGCDRIYYVREHHRYWRCRK